MNRNNSGFTLIEVIISLAILSIVVGILFSLFSFVNHTLALGKDSSGNQFNARFTAGQIATKLHNANTVALLDDSQITNLITSGAFDRFKQYIFVKVDPVTGNKSIMHRSGNHEYVFLGGLKGTVNLQFSNVAGSNMISYSVQSVINGRGFIITSQVFLHNMVAGGIINTPSGNTGVAVCFGPIESADIVQFDKSELIPPALANTITTDLVLPLIGPYGSNITWTSLTPGLITLPTVTQSDRNLGFITATVTKPLGSTPVISSLRAEFVNGTYNTSREYQVSIPPFGALNLSAPPVVASGTRNVAYTYTFLADGGRGNFTFTGTSLPVGLSLSSTGVLSGTPTIAGSSTMVITVTDGYETVSKSVGITIYNALSITTNSLPDAKRNTFYTFDRFEAGGGNGSIEFSSNNLPNGLYLNSNGILNGTPSNNGNYTITVTAKDIDGRSISKNFNLQVKN